jgi:hypothetical protein
MIIIILSSVNTLMSASCCIVPLSVLNYTYKLRYGIFWMFFRRIRHDHPLWSPLLTQQFYHSVFILLQDGFAIAREERAIKMRSWFVIWSGSSDFERLATVCNICSYPPFKQEALSATSTVLQIQELVDGRTPVWRDAWCTCSHVLLLRDGVVCSEGASKAHEVSGYAQQLSGVGHNRCITGRAKPGSFTCTAISESR